jgi:hypothetical protein
MCMFHISSVASFTLYNFLPQYLKKAQFSKEKKLLNTNVFCFPQQGLSETFLILSRIELDMIKMYIVLHIQYSLF